MATTIKIDGMSLMFQDDDLVLERTYGDDHQFLITEYGAERRGKKLTKRFPRSRFHATKREIDARLRVFRESCDFVSGMSGYSSLSTIRCIELGIREGDYEAAVVGLMTSAVNRVRSQLPKVRYGLVYGSSAMGVDLAIEQVASEQNIPLVGFTCPEYLWYVCNDTKGPHICVLPTKDKYCKDYVNTCNLLMASNGGQVSYKKDIIAATEALIPVLPIDVIGMLGASIPAFKLDGTVNDAVGALLHVMRLVGFHNEHGLAEDRYQRVANQFADAVTARAREVVPSPYAFEALRT